MYHSLYGRLLGHDGSQLLYNQRPLSFSAKGPRGKVVFVDSNVAASDGFSPDTALATLDSAFDKVTANQGDVIYVMPKHAETLSGANGVLQDIAGVSVIGLGEGNQRPTFTYSTSAAATYGITAADSVVENLLFIGNVSNVVAGITTTKSGTKLRKLEFRNAGTNKDFLTPIKHTSTVDNDGDGLEVSDCSWFGNDSDDLEFIEINATLDRFKCYNNYVFNLGTASPLILVATGKLLTQADIGWNRLFNQMTANELFISNDGTTNTGILHNNYVGHKDVTGAHDPGWDGGGFRLFNCLSTSVDNLQGLPIPTTDVNL